MTNENENPVPQGARGQFTSRFIELVNEVSSQIRPELLDVQSDIELTLFQFRALSILRGGPLRVSDIAARLGIRLSSATKLIGRLEAKGLLERIPDPQDRRFVWCRLTSPGMREAEALGNINRQLLQSVSASLTDEELQVVTHTFEVLLSALQRQASEDPSAA